MSPTFTHTAVWLLNDYNEEQNKACFWLLNIKCGPGEITFSILRKSCQFKMNWIVYFACLTSYPFEVGNKKWLEKLKQIFRKLSVVLDVVSLNVSIYRNHCFFQFSWHLPVGHTSIFMISLKQLNLRNDCYQVNFCRSLTRLPIFIVLVRPEAPNSPKYWNPPTLPEIADPVQLCQSRI